MSKRVRILVAPTCVSAMLSAVVPVFAKNDQETLDVQSAIEYLLAQGRQHHRRSHRTEFSGT